MSVTLRPAVAADLPFLVWSMREASTSHLERSVWSMVLGLSDEYVSELLGAVATAEHPHWCHLSRFRVAEVDGSAVAAASSYDPVSEGNDVLFAEAVQILARAGAAPESVQQAMRHAMIVDGVTPKPYPDAWGIENVAVVPEHRGVGLAALLLDAAVADARSHGREHVQIMCLDGNDRAQRAWERAGFSVRAEYRGRECGELLGANGMKLLVRDVAAMQPV